MELKEPRSTKYQLRKSLPVVPLHDYMSLSTFTHPLEEIGNSANPACTHSNLRATSNVEVCCVVLCCAEVRKESNLGDWGKEKGEGRRKEDATGVRMAKEREQERGTVMFK